MKAHEIKLNLKMALPEMFPLYLKKDITKSNDKLCVVLNGFTGFFIKDFNNGDIAYTPDIEKADITTLAAAYAVINGLLNKEEFEFILPHPPVFIDPITDNFTIAPPPMPTAILHKTEYSETTYDIWVGAVLVGTVFKMRKYYRVSISDPAIYKAWRNARKPKQYLLYDDLLKNLNEVLTAFLTPFFKPFKRPLK